MKKLFSTAIAVLAAVSLWAQKPVIEFDQTTHDFGKINEADGRVTTIFTFQNTGMTPLVLSEVRASCGCTTPKWTREPVEPGQQGTITVTYNPSGRPGNFNKTITVTSNADPATTRLYIKGEVIPKSAKPVDNYPVKMGSFGLKANTIDMGAVKKGETATKTIGYSNTTNDTLYVRCLPAADYINAVINIEKQETAVAPKSKGEMNVLFFGDRCKQYGPVETTFYVVVNGDENVANAVTVTANIQEDFSQMTEAELAAAPIADISKEINLGTFAQNKRNRTQFHVANAGQSPLMIRRIVSNDARLGFTPAKSIKSGKKGANRIEMQPMEKGNYTTEITVITNDPKNAVHTITLRWTIE